MSDIAIRAENLSKRYRIGQQEKRHDTLINVALHTLRSPFENLGKLRRLTTFSDDGHEPEDMIWALKDVSIEVKRGEVVGVIGRNGAGKSTLLKILSRITYPTSGRVETRGRVSSLLEVGTGFHPELTGRENVYLNGTILGMTKAEIDNKFDEIVEFAEIQKFVDTPVKRYSSGMGVRLAFSVAAHLEPEILLIDEVLAVGDAEFQKKCLGKMEDIEQQGRTVLFVSHNMSMILRLCKRALLVHNGKIVVDGDVNTVTETYLASGTISKAERIWSDLEKAPGNSIARLKAVRVLDQNGQITETVDIREPVSLQVEYLKLPKSLESNCKLTAIIHLVNDQGITLFASNEWNNKNWGAYHRLPGLIRATCKIPENFLAEGRFFVLAAIGSYNPDRIHALERDVVSFQVVDRSTGDAARGKYAGGNWPGVLRPYLGWEIEMEPEHN